VTFLVGSYDFPDLRKNYVGQDQVVEMLETITKVKKGSWGRKKKATVLVPSFLHGMSGFWMRV